MVLPRDEPPFPVEPRFQPMHVGWTVAAAAHVILAGPLHAHRSPADRLRDGDGLHDDIAVRDRAPAEAAAGLHHMQRHLVRVTPATCAAIAW